MSAPRRAGVTVFLTGLSGAGKSTIADALVASLEADGRPVTVLDGDVVRTHLSSELSFSKEHRDLNIRRIGFVAGEVVKHGGTAVVAAIAPYDRAREEARELVERHGRFVLVHLATPLEVCEARDVKGLYARARSGELTGFTGVDDPYEPPSRAEVVVDTSVTPLAESVARIRAAMDGGTEPVD
jgi:adenylyl-sulfate kinase